jgi:hypothetical protein
VISRAHPRGLVWILWGDVGEAAVLTEGDEVEIAFVLATLQDLGNAIIVREMGGSGRALARLPTHGEKMS